MNAVETAAAVIYWTAIVVYFVATFAAIPRKPRSVRWQFAAVLAAAVVASVDLWSGAWLRAVLWVSITALAAITLRNKRVAVSDV